MRKESCIYWKEAGLNGGPPCVGKFGMCKCKKCICLKDILGTQCEMQGMYLQKQDFEKYENEFESEVEHFMKELVTLDNMCLLPDFDYEIDAIISGFIQREISSDDVIKAFSGLLKTRGLVGKEFSALPEMEIRCVKNVLKDIWMFYMP